MIGYWGGGAVVVGVVVVDVGSSVVAIVAAREAERMGEPTCVRLAINEPDFTWESERVSAGSALGE